MIRLNQVNKRAFTALALEAQASYPAFAFPAIKFGQRKQVAPTNSKANRYVFDRERNEIGSGMFATVYKATDSQTKEEVAVKVIDKKTCQKQIFQQEMKVMAQIKESLGNSSGVEALALPKDTIETDSEIKFVFQLAKGGDLFDELFENGAVSEEELRTIVKRIVPALKEMHKKGFVHRDIKPENVLLGHSLERADKFRDTILSDFGYAKKLTEKDSFNNPAGTFGYVAPEVLSARTYTSACDIWSLGSVLFTAKAAYTPFPSEEDDTLESRTSENLSKKELEAIIKGSSEEEWGKEMGRTPFKDASTEFKDLLRQMLEVDHHKRISAEEILSHPWLTESQEEEAMESFA